MSHCVVSPLPTQPALRSPLNIGFLIGGSFMLSMQLLTLSVLSGGKLASFGVKNTPAEQAVAAFSVILFIAFVRPPPSALSPSVSCAAAVHQGAFTALLVAVRTSLLADSGEPQFTGVGGGGGAPQGPQFGGMSASVMQGDVMQPGTL